MYQHRKGCEVMFGRRHSGRQSINPLFVIFRVLLSMVMFAVLLAGVIAAYKHFSGLDPLKIDPKTFVTNVTNLINAKTPQQVLGILPSQASTNKPQISGKVVFKFLALADSHSDNNNLKKAITLAKGKYPDIQFIIGLGDYTEVGTLDELRLAKKELDLIGLRYFLIPGDHDLWDSRDKQTNPVTNFKQVFGPTYQSFTFGSFRFLLLYNSDNYIGMDEEQIKWLGEELEKAKQEKSGVFVFVHEPLYHPSSDHVMGRVEKGLKLQAKNIIYQLKDAHVKKVFAGDIHYFSEYNEPETNLAMITVGAVTTSRNAQAPRFAVVFVFEDGSTGVEDIEIR